jgi:hypothetical protein
MCLSKSIISYYLWYTFWTGQNQLYKEYLYVCPHRLKNYQVLYLYELTVFNVLFQYDQSFALQLLKQF